MIWNGVPLGFDREGRAVSNPGPAPTCVLGPPGSGKTTDVTCNMLLDEPGRQSFFVADTKGTVHAITHKYRGKVCGNRNVRLINPKNVLNAGSDKWNPINFDPTSFDFEDRCQNAAVAAIPETNEKQTHFSLAARSAMAGGIIFDNREAVRLNRAPSIGRVRAMWTQDPKSLRDMVKRMMATGDPAITTRVSKFLADTEELENIKSTIEAATSWMTAAYRADMDTAAGVAFRACRERPTTVYATIPIEDTVDKGIYFRLLLQEALSEFYRHPGIKVTIIIEEGFVLGRLEILEKTIAVAREFGVDIVIVFQFLGQIKQLYPATWQQFVSGTLLAYRPGDMESAEFLSKRAGEFITPVLSAADPSSSNDVDARPSWQQQTRPRIPLGKMFAMPKGRALAFLPGDDAPRVVRTRGYFDLPLNARAGRNPYFRG